MPCIDSVLYQLVLLVTLLHFDHAVHSRVDEKDLSKSILDFAIGFSRHQSSSQVVGRRSLVWSPLSLYESMLMVSEGAEGRTLTDLQRLTHLNSRENHRLWSSTLLNDAKKSLKANHQYNVSVNIANRLYTSKDFNLDEQFNANLKKHYHSELELLDFSQAQQSADRINAWVSSQTNNAIKDVLKKTDIDATTRLMLVNALHFKAPWAKPFEADLTSDEEFTLSTGRLVKLPTMNLVSHFAYHHDKKHQSQWINLPYKGNRYVLTLGLPEKDVELRTLEGNLRNGKSLASVFQALDNQTNPGPRVQLSLPKFRIESTLNFVDHFKNFYGVKAPFDANQADFSLMSAGRERDLFISKIIHKAVIDVDEAGTEAAAVTVTQILSRSGMFLHEDPIKLAFSRPFLFYLRDMNLKVPLFVGRYTGTLMP